MYYCILFIIKIIIQPNLYYTNAISTMNSISQSMYRDVQLQTRYKWYAMDYNYQGPQPELVMKNYS